MSAPALVRVSPACAAAAAAALDRARPGVGAALPRWLLPGDRAPYERSTGRGDPGQAAPGGAGRLGAPPPLAAALAAAVAAPVCVDVTVLDGATCLRGRWSLGAGPATVLVLGADAAGAPQVEAGLVAAVDVVAGVARLLPPGTDPDAGSRTGPRTLASGHPARVCAADLLALSALEPLGAHRLLSDLARTRGAPTADAVQRCVASTARVDLDVRCGTTTWCATWLVGPAWLRLDPGPEPGQLVAVPAGPPDVLDVLAGTLRAVALGGAVGRAGAPLPTAARAGAARAGAARAGATRAGDPG